MNDVNFYYRWGWHAFLVLSLWCVASPVVRGCGAYPPPALDDAPVVTPRRFTVTADDGGASTCAQMKHDDVMWELIAAEEVGRAVRFVGCVEVVP